MLGRTKRADTLCVVVPAGSGVSVSLPPLVDPLKYLRADVRTHVCVRVRACACMRV